ncbi:MAG TPA: ubiquitin-like domain-containing protein [Mycobacteriales bacterium]
MRKRLFQGLILSTLLTSGYVWVSFDKTVSVEVDGQPRAVRTFARTVGGVLDQIGVEPGQHDLVAPAANVDVKDGSRVVFRHGRQLTLRLNGETKSVWVTALSVEEALQQLAIRDASGAWLSASRSRSIPVDGMHLEVRTPARVNVAVDGKVRTITTTVATVREALLQANVRLAAADNVSVPLNVLPLDGLTIRVTRIRAGKESQTIAIPFGTVRKPDPRMWLGDTRVATRGVPGARLRVWALTYTDKRLTGRKLTTDKVVRHPVTEVVYYGTRRRTVDDLNWRALAQCESGNNPRAVGGGGLYRGLYQFRMSTWYSVGGTGDPINASREEQTYRAKKLYLRAGRSPWPYCGRFL